MSTTNIQAIDVHAHYGQYDDGAVPHASALKNRFMSGEIDVVLARARQANTQYTVVSPLAALMMGVRNDVLGANEVTARLAGETAGVLQWAVVNPLCPPSYAQAAEMLKSPRCVGIKVHPVLHGYRFTDYAMPLIAFAAEHGAVVQSHTGEEGCLPGEYVAAADAFPGVSIIMAHLGFGYDHDYSHHVRAIQRSKHGNLYADTSSASSIVSNLLEWAVAEVGADHLLYGTDTPLYYAPMQRARIDCAGISDAEKRLILRENALRLFGLPAEH